MPYHMSDIFLQKPWLSEPRKIWENYTNQDHQASVTLLYVMQLGLYLTLLATLFELRHKVNTLIISIIIVLTI